MNGGKRALLSVFPKIELNKYEQGFSETKEVKQKQIVDSVYVRTVNELARQKFKQRILNDILVDLMICEIEGWCKLEYINELKNLITKIGNETVTDQSHSPKISLEK